MRDKVVFSKSKEGFNIRVGVFTKDENTGETVFLKHKPHFMRVVGGYGIQKQVQDENKRNWNMQEVFRLHKDLKIVITDGGSKYTSTAQDWLEHYHHGNYGYGDQMFLSVEYMAKA